MSASNMTEYTCDRCGKQARLPEREQPKRWHRVTKTEPVLASPLEGKVSGDWHFCHDCSEALHDWIIEAHLIRVVGP